MFYAAKKEVVEQLFPGIKDFQPEKTRIFYTDQNGEKRCFIK